jgi:hypothetical protein
MLKGTFPPGDAAGAPGNETGRSCRPFGVVQEALRGLEQDARWQSSKACREATVEASRAFCKGYFEVRGEAARATEAAQLEQRIGELKGKATHLEEQGAGREADNQAAVLARVRASAI